MSELRRQANDTRGAVIIKKIVRTARRGYLIGFLDDASSCRGSGKSARAWLERLLPELEADEKLDIGGGIKNPIVGASGHFKKGTQRRSKAHGPALVTLHGHVVARSGIPKNLLNRRAEACVL